MRNLIVGVVVLAVIILFGWMIFRNRNAAPADTGTPGVTNTPGTNNPDNNSGGPAKLPVVGTQATSDDIVIDTPKVGDKIGSPLTVKGRARGGWYFEASAPVMVIDTSGKVLGQGFVTAEGEWMTSDFVPFSGTVRFSGATTNAGAVVFMNDNPSGDPERQKFWAVPVIFK
ncbi:Gmad2 immunoglobulin-like domain-containing protein [Candidatus Parcubacteria bacterium]|nr:Gmad2 immunoglobulin-like domain-containing protein [Candidatus Parcubacteria bacterium]